MKTEFNINIITILFLTMIIISSTSIILFNIFLSTDIKQGMSCSMNVVNYKL